MPGVWYAIVVCAYTMHVEDVGVGVKCEHLSKPVATLPESCYLYCHS